MVVDDFGSRAVAYNNAAAQHRNQVILSNIIRAALGRPLQFTELSTVTGTAQTRGSIAGLFPFPGQLPLTATQLFSINPTVEASGGPSFNISNLSSREFYTGIMAPITMAQAAYYANRPGFEEVFLALAIAELRWGPAAAPRIFRNRNDAAGDAIRFGNALRPLLANGLTIETVESFRAMGPPLSATEARNPQILATVATTTDNPPVLRSYSLRAGALPDPNLADRDRVALRGRLGADATYFRLERKSTSARFCFIEDKLPSVPHTILYRASRESPGEPLVTVTRENLCGAGRAPGASGLIGGEVDQRPLSVTFRSVQDVFLLLGQIADSSPPVATGNGGTGILFQLHRTPPQGPSMSATVAGETRYVALDPTGRDSSGRVLQLLAELIALNSAAKDLPLPTVLPVVTR